MAFNLKKNCIKIAPHCLLQAILKRSVVASAANFGLMKAKTDNMMYLLSSLGKIYQAGASLKV